MEEGTTEQGEGKGGDLFPVKGQRTKMVRNLQMEVLSRGGPWGVHHQWKQLGGCTEYTTIPIKLQGLYCKFFPCNLGYYPIL